MLIDLYSTKYRMPGQALPYLWSRLCLQTGCAESTWCGPDVGLIPPNRQVVRLVLVSLWNINKEGNGSRVSSCQAGKCGVGLLGVICDDSEPREEGHCFSLRSPSPSDLKGAALMWGQV